MAVCVKIKVNRVWCDRMKREVDLIEERIYPDEAITGPAASYHVQGHYCTLAVNCNMAGYHCRWAMTNPEVDPDLK